jgi:hypothetical protein
VEAGGDLSSTGSGEVAAGGDQQNKGNEEEEECDTDLEIDGKNLYQ